jgi:hypothetical protein
MDVALAQMLIERDRLVIVGEVAFHADVADTPGNYAFRNDLFKPRRLHGITLREMPQTQCLGDNG